MKYRAYPLNCERLTRVIRKNKMVKFAKKETQIERIRKSLSWLYKQNRKMVTTMECVIHAEEYVWLKSDKRVYFPVDLAMAESIMKGTYSVKDENAFYIEPETFILNLPECLSFNGNDKGSGLLVVISPHNDRAVSVYRNFTDWIEIPPVNVTVDNDSGEFTIMVTYQDILNSETYMRLAVPSFNAVKILQMNSPEEYIQFMHDDNRFNFERGHRLSDVELTYQYEMIRFVCGFMVYKKALPNRIVSGLPSVYGKLGSTPLTKNKQNYVVKHPTGERAGSAGHYRSWHFRQLMNERYYRGEHKKEKVGSRVIFVSDSYVVRDIDAKTVKG